MIYTHVNAQVAARVAIAAARAVGVTVPIRAVAALSFVVLLLAVVMLWLGGLPNMARGRALAASLVHLPGQGHTAGDAVDQSSDWTIAALLTSVCLYGSAAGTFSITRPVITAMVYGRQRFGAISGKLAACVTCGTAVAPTVAAVLWRVGGYSLVLRALGTAVLAGLTAILVLLRITPTVAEDSGASVVLPATAAQADVQGDLAPSASPTPAGSRSRGAKHTEEKMPLVLALAVHPSQDSNASRAASH